MAEAKAWNADHVFVDADFTGPYEGLAKYFRGFRVSALLEFDEEELANMVSPEDKFRVRQFARTQLSAAGGKGEDPFQEEGGLVQRVGQDVVLALQRKVVPCAFKNMRPDLLNMDTLLEKWKDKPNVLASVTLVDLSCNNLLDGDLPKIAEFIQQISSKAFRLCLSSNRLYGRDAAGEPIAEVDEAIVRMLLMEKVLFLDILHNPLASVDRKDLFQRLAQSHTAVFRKLIWVPNSWLEGSSWKTMLPEKFDCRLVYDAHRRYFGENAAKRPG
jgi:hypothetical protein